MPDATDNDPWADLYADLGVTEKPARPAPAAHSAPVSDEAATDEPAEGEEGDDDSDEEAGEGTATADDGTTKKRRRRRRRGKKKPGDETAEGATADGPDENETPEYGRHATQPAPARQPAASAPTGDSEGDSDADNGDDAAAPAEVSAEAERPLEGATTEMTRELIANWNVPSWEELVTGLHRPSH